MLNGFPGGQVNGVAQTPDGYLWIGTDRGLFRFDGLTFVDARQLDSSISSSLHVLDLQTDNEGSLWVRQERPELLRYRNGQFEDYFATRDEKESGVIAMNRAQNGDLLISALIHGKLRFRSGQLHQLLRAAPSTSLAISIAETPDGRVWIGTRDEGLYWLDEHGIVPAPGTLPDKKVNAIVPAGNGRLWIGTDNGLALWNGSKTTTDGIPADLEKVQILALLRDRDDNLWIGTPRGLFRLDPGGVASRDPLTASVTAIFEDREGSLWVGSPQGIQLLRDSAFVAYSLGTSDPSPGGGPIYVAPDGRAWIAPSTGGLYSMLRGKVTRITAAGLDRDVVYSIDGGPNDLWLGRQRDGLTHLSLENGSVTGARTYTHLDGLPQSRIYAVRRNSDGSVWAATLNGGFSLLRYGRFTTFTTANGFPSNSVTAIENTADATWFGTPQGLARLTHAGSASGAPQWRTFTGADGLPSSDIISLLAGSSGVLWIGTSSGLAVLRSGRIQPIANLPAGLRDPIFGIAEDQHGSLWIATSTRLLSVDTAALLAAPPSPLHLREYSSADGLPGTETVRRDRSVIADARGRIWFSLNQGLASIDPARAFAASAPALTHIESITADSNPVPLDSSARLPASTQRLIFDYAGLSLGVPGRIRYRYRLDSFDRDWSKPVSHRQAVYTNLAPGNYRFRVLSSNSDGQWGQQEATYSFHIAPALWQTWWFQLSLVAALGILTILIFRWRMLQIAERLKLRFEERLAERTRIAQELHDTLLQGFLSASMQLHVAAEQLPPDSPARASLDRVLKLMQHVNQEGRNTLRGLRSESSSLTLEQALSRVPNDLSPNPAAFRVIVQGHSRSLHPVIRDEASRIGREAIVNAFLHARATAIEAEIEYTPGHLHLLVRDDGIGIDPEVLRSGREGHWGLIGMRERASHIEATLKVFSRAEAGTEVELTVPGHVAYQNPGSSLRLRLSHLWNRLRQRTAH